MNIIYFIIAIMYLSNTIIRTDNYEKYLDKLFKKDNSLDDDLDNDSLSEIEDTETSVNNNGMNINIDDLHF